MASTTRSGVTIIGSLRMVSPGAVARLATRSSSSWLGLLMPIAAKVFGRPMLSENASTRNAIPWSASSQSAPRCILPLKAYCDRTAPHY
jgi:hypothetical protein